MTRKEILKAMFEAVLEAEEKTGGEIWFEYSPHVDSVGVYTVSSKRYPHDGGGYEHIFIFSPLEMEITEKDLDALRWRLLPENLEKIWKGAQK